MSVEREYWDGLISFLLKGIRPEKYSERLNLHLPSIDAAIEQLFERLGVDAPTLPRSGVPGTSKKVTALRGGARRLPPVDGAGPGG